MNAQNKNKNSVKNENVSKSENVDALTLALAEIEREEKAELEKIAAAEKQLIEKRAKQRKNKFEYEKFYTNAQFVSQSYLIESALAHEVCPTRPLRVQVIAELCDCSRERVLQHLSHLKRESHAKFELDATKQIIKKFECDRIASK